MLDLELYIQAVTDELVEVFPEKDPQFIKDKVREFATNEHLDPSLGERFAGFCVQCDNNCCKDCDLGHKINGATYCKIQFRKPRICKLYPIWHIKDECGVYPDPTCELAVKIGKYVLMEELR